MLASQFALGAEHRLVLPIEQHAHFEGLWVLNHHTFASCVKERPGNVVLQDYPVPGLQGGRRGEFQLV
jgi:hypothetical protein